LTIFAFINDGCAAERILRIERLFFCAESAKNQPLNPKNLLAAEGGV